MTISKMYYYKSEQRCREGNGYGIGYRNKTDAKGSAKRYLRFHKPAL